MAGAACAVAGAALDRGAALGAGAAETAVAIWGVAGSLRPQAASVAPKASEAHEVKPIQRRHRTMMSGRACGARERQGAVVADLPE